LRRRARLFLAACLVCAPCGPAAAEEFSGSAHVRDDGSLRIRNREVRLWGIAIIPTHEDCLRHVRPPVCGPRAALALRQGITGFVRCTTVRRAAGGVVEAQCFTGYDSFDPGVDLAAYLLNRGWALAAPGAPPHYQALERIARHHGLGLWGSPGVSEP
jgi:endonuclease YncB( thermonuclease family)